MTPVNTRIVLIAFTAFGALHCSSSSDGNNGSAGSTAQAGSSVGGSAAGGAVNGGGPSGGSPAGGAPAGGAAAGGASAAGTGGNGAAGVGGASSAGATQGGSGGMGAGSGGQATGGGSSAGAGGQGGGGGFALTSSKLTAGMAFPPEFTCASTSDHSPPLAWTPGPSAALSYALVLLDTNNNFNHWVVWDIPPSTTTLPESLPTTATLTMPAGAKQAAGSGMGYLGPCPSGTLHTYKFTLYALDVATLPSVTTSTSTMSLAAAIEMHDIASATLSATSDAKKP